MYRPVAGKPDLGLGLLMLLILVLNACGEEPRKIPESSGGRSMKSIPAGKYVSDEFRPAMSFRLNEGWQTGPAADFSYGLFMEKYNRLTLSRVSESGPSYLEFRSYRRSTRSLAPTKQRKSLRPRIWSPGCRTTLIWTQRIRSR